jgi:release factor glutamine methyltransferase
MGPGTAIGTVGALLDDLSLALAGHGAPPDRGGARDLIAAVLDRPRFWPTAHRDTALDEAQHDAVRTAAAALRGGMPFAYAVGKAAFRHLTLRVDRRVLIPRPETELLVDLALAATGGRGIIADVGTGSGAIALALAAEGAYERVIATDRSESALDVARANLRAIPADRRHVVEFRLGDLVAPLGGEQVAALVSNPPYIATTELQELPLSVANWEPADALLSGQDGMYAIDRLVVEAAHVVAPRGLLLLEVDSRRAQLALRRAETTGRWSDVELRPDLTGRERFLVARRSTR